MCFTLQVDKVVELRHPKSQPDIGEIRKNDFFNTNFVYILQNDEYYYDFLRNVTNVWLVINLKTPSK